MFHLLWNGGSINLIEQLSHRLRRKNNVLRKESRAEGGKERRKIKKKKEKKRDKVTCGLVIKRKDKD